MLNTRIISTLAVLGAATTGANASVFDFDDPSLQDTLVSSVTTSDGAITAELTVVANINRSNRDHDGDGFADVNEALIFNAASGADADPDLQFADAGGVLVIAENDLSGRRDLPDDNGNGGSITFDFVQAVTLEGFTVYDDARITVVTTDATFVADVPGDGETLDFTIGDDRFAGVTSLTFDFGSHSGAIDDIIVSLTAIPLPAGLPLMLAGLGALGIAGRRKKAA